MAFIFKIHGTLVWYHLTRTLCRILDDFTWIIASGGIKFRWNVLWRLVVRRDSFNMLPKWSNQTADNGICSQQMLESPTTNERTTCVRQECSKCPLFRNKRSEGLYWTIFLAGYITIQHISIWATYSNASLQVEYLQLNELSHICPYCQQWHLPLLI